MSKDKELVCKDCGETFPFTAGEQDFYNEKGLAAPKRCKRCRRANKMRQASDY